jgi:hypothetical protein
LDFTVTFKGFIFLLVFYIQRVAGGIVCKIRWRRRRYTCHENKSYALFYSETQKTIAYKRAQAMSGAGKVAAMVSL